MNKVVEGSGLAEEDASLDEARVVGWSVADSAQKQEKDAYVDMSEMLIPSFAISNTS